MSHGGSDRILWVDAKDNLPRPSKRRSGTLSLAMQTTHCWREGEGVLAIYQPLTLAFALTLVFSPSPPCGAPFAPQV